MSDAFDDLNIWNHITTTLHICTHITQNTLHSGFILALFTYISFTSMARNGIFAFIFDVRTSHSKKRETELDTVLNKRVHKLLSVCSVDHLDDVGLFSFLLRLFFSVQSAIRAGVN